jgi:hypothetical protein
MLRRGNAEQIIRVALKIGTDSGCRLRRHDLGAALHIMGLPVNLSICDVSGVGQPGSFPWAPTCRERYYDTGIFINMALVNVGFHTRNNFSENYPQFGYAASKIFARLVLG